MVEQEARGNFVALKNKVLSGKFVKHVFEGGVGPLDDALTLGVVRYAKFVENSKLGEKGFQGRGGIRRTIIRLDRFWGAQNRKAVRKMGDDIFCCLSGVEGGGQKTTEGVHSDMDILEGAKRLKMSNISLPQCTRDEPSGVHSCVGLWQKGDTFFARLNNVSCLVPSDGEPLAKSVSV